MTRGGNIGWGVAAVLAVAVSGCRDSGLPDRNLPLEAARTRTFLYPVYTAEPAAPVRVGDRDWITAGAPLRIPGRLLTPVTEDGTVFALATDATPRARLYRRTADGYTPLAPMP